MKPTRNRVMCPDCGRAKMLFETKEKAQRFIDWNGEELPYGGDRLRPYHCPACCGWHISHKEYNEQYEDRTERMIEAFHDDVRNGNKKRLKPGQCPQMDAKTIFENIPYDIKDTGTKTQMRATVKEFLKRNGVNDPGGSLLGGVYVLWKRFKIERSKPTALNGAINNN